MRRSSSAIDPPLTGTKPVTASMSVVLPAPFGPIRPTTSPGRTSIDTSSTATTEPKRTVRPVIDSVAAGDRLDLGRQEAGARSGRRATRWSFSHSGPAVHDDVGDAVLVDDEDHEEDERTDDEVPPVLEVEPVLDDAGADAADRVRSAEHRAEHVAETADHGVAEAVDRREDVELRVRDDLAPEADEDAGDGGEAGRDRERVQLDAEHRDAERRGGALVRAHRDEPAAGARSAEVGDEQREEHEADQAHRRPRVRVVERVDLDAEQLHAPDSGAAVERAAEVVGFANTTSETRKPSRA